MRKRITAWSAWNKEKGRFVHNHIEDEYVAGMKPKPLKPEFKSQAKSWPSQKWQKSYGYIDEDSRVCLIFKNIFPASMT